MTIPFLDVWLQRSEGARWALIFLTGHFATSHEALNCFKSAQSQQPPLR